VFLFVGWVDMIVFFDERIESILDFILGSPNKYFAHIRPFAANEFMIFEDKLILLLGPI
jgi:hypothetical protein